MTYSNDNCIDTQRYKQSNILIRFFQHVTSLTNLKNNQYKSSIIHSCGKKYDFSVTFTQIFMSTVLTLLQSDIRIIRKCDLKTTTNMGSHVEIFTDNSTNKLGTRLLLKGFVIRT